MTKSLDFAEILALEIKEMDTKIDAAFTCRKLIQDRDGYLEDKELVRLCVQLTKEISDKQNARTALKQALAAYTKVMK